MATPTETIIRLMDDDNRFKGVKIDVGMILCHGLIALVKEQPEGFEVSAHFANIILEECEKGLKEEPQYQAWVQAQNENIKEYVDKMEKLVPEEEE